MVKLDFSDTPYLDSMIGKQPVVNHIHWDGSIPPKELFQLYQARGWPLKLPERRLDGTTIQGEERIIDTVEKLHAFQTGLLTEYDIVSVFAIPIGLMKTPKDMEGAALAYCKYLESQGIVAAETQFAPFYHVNPGSGIPDLDHAVGYALEAFAKAKEQTGVKNGLVIDINRETDEETAIKIAKTALKFQGRGVIALGLACDERTGPPARFQRAFESTFDSSLYRTVHTGEMMGDDTLNNLNTEYVLKYFRLHSLAHAISLHNRRDLIEIMLKENIRLESNPISNAQFFIREIKDLHLDQLVRAGVRVTTNPDDPFMWKDGHLSHNLYFLGKMYGDEFVNTVVRNAIETSWVLTPEEKTILISGMVKTQ